MFMKQIILTEVPCGYFQTTTTIEPSDAVYHYFAEQGALRFVQNVATPEWEKKEAIRLGLWPIDAKTGKATRPKGYTRKQIPFSEESLQALLKAIGLAKVEIGEDEDKKPIYHDAGVVDVTGAEYTGTGPEPKFKACRDFIKAYLFKPDGTAYLAADGTARTVELFAEKRGLDAPTDPWEQDMEWLSVANSWYQENVVAKQQD